MQNPPLLPAAVGLWLIGLPLPPAQNHLCQWIRLGDHGSRPQLLERLEQIQRKIKKGLPVSEQEVLPSNELRWYMVQTANGFERAVERTIGQVIDAQNMQDDIEKVFVPVTEGESSVRDASVMPSYIFVKMRMDAGRDFVESSFVAHQAPCARPCPKALAHTRALTHAEYSSA